MATNTSQLYAARGAASEPVIMPKTAPNMANEVPRGHRWQSKGDAAIYYSVFSVLFVFSLIVFSGLKLTGHHVSGGIFKASKRAANGPAGYAVKV